MGNERRGLAHEFRKLANALRSASNRWEDLNADVEGASEVPGFPFMGSLNDVAADAEGYAERLEAWAKGEG